MKRIASVFCIIALTFPVAAQELHYQPLQPLTPTLQMPTLPTWQEYNNEYHIPTYQPAVSTYQAPQRRIDPRDYMQQFDSPATLRRQVQIDNRQSERNRWSACAKYNSFCVNMLRSLGGN